MNRRRIIADTCTLGKRKNHIYFFTELDITAFQEFRSQQKVSATAYHSRALGRVINDGFRFAMSKHHASGKLDGDTVDVQFQVEKDLGGRLVPIGYFLRNVTNRSLEELDADVKAARDKQEDENFWFASLPRFLRLLLLRFVMSRPNMHVKNFGTLMMTSVGSVSCHCGWLQPITVNDFAVAYGSRREEDGRTLQKMTFLFNHDLIDGGDAARFIDAYQEELLAHS